MENYTSTTIWATRESEDFIAYAGSECGPDARVHITLAGTTIYFTLENAANFADALASAVAEVKAKRVEMAKAVLAAEVAELV